MKGAERKNVKVIGHTDMDGRGDAICAIRRGDYLYVGHVFSRGISILDVSNPRRPRVAKWLPNPSPNTWNTNIGVSGDLLLAADERDLFTGNPLQWSAAGMAIYDISKPAEPRKIAYWKTSGQGVHRIWFVDGRMAHVPAHLEGYTGFIYTILDLADPTRPQEVGRWWHPGMWEAGGETPTWKPPDSVWLHGCVVHGNRSYGGWWDGGFVILDISDYSDIKYVSGFNWRPPYGGATHSTIPLPDRHLLIVGDEAIADNCEEGEKLAWVVDIRAEKNPVPIATFPVPEGPYKHPGVRFGPHCIWENRPDGLVSDELIFMAYFRAGLRIFDISNPYRPEEVGYFVPPPPRKMVDPRPGRARAPSSQDLFVDKEGLIYLTDYNCGIYILEFTG